jgi:serine phosphatase RsbU (regulator of sigma subunit)
MLPSEEGERTMIRTARPRTAADDGRAGWVHFLVYSDELGQLQRLRLGSSPVRVGRRAPSEVVLRDAEVSGVHCELQLRGDDLVVRDLGSTNGTFVDGLRVTTPVLLPHGGLLQVGRQQLKHEFRDAHELAQSAELDRDLTRASAYLRSLLPAPLLHGPVRAEWHFEPSARVGGDAFGYHRLDHDRLAMFLLDVSGHGVGAAMHAVSVLTALRQQTLPDVDFGNPAQVLGRLNDLFPMDAHGGMFFTIWYGVLHLPTQRLRYASGGQHPAYVLPAAGGALQPLATHNLLIGAMPDIAFDAAEAQLAPGDRLYLFSDGVFEIVTAAGRTWLLDDLLPLLGKPVPPGRSEPAHVFEVVRGLARQGPLDDDFSFLVLAIG